MSRYRRTSMLLAAGVAAAVVLSPPAKAETAPVTLAVEGTLEVIAVDGFGSHAHADHLYTVVTDDGASIPVDLELAPANGRFEGELVVEGAVASALDDADLLPRAGSTISSDSRAGDVAVAAAEQQSTPLAVAESTVAPATAAAVTTSGPHRAYVAVMTNRGSGTVPTVEAATQAVSAIGDYWETETGGVVSDFSIVGDVRTYASTISATDDVSCGTGTTSKNLDAMWAEARSQFAGVTFRAQGDHLIVLLNSSCTVGIATVGTSLSSGGSVAMVVGNGDDQIGVHELGHNFGLDHANLQRCPSAAACSSQEYLDLFSPMALAVTGASPEFMPPALDSAFRSRLGLADSSEVQLVSQATGPAVRTVRLQGRSSSAGTRGLEVVDPSSGVHYFVEYRSGAGRDAGTFYASPRGLQGVDTSYDPGVTVSTISTAGAVTLLPRTTATGYAGSFASGQTYVSPEGSLQIAVGATAAGGIDVTVSYPAGAPTTPTPTPTPTSPTSPAPTNPAPTNPAPTTPAPTAVQPLSFVSASPRISGTAKVGRTVKVKVGSWSPRPSFTYQWLANGRPIAKGTKASYRLTSAQKGKRITVRVTATKAGYTTIAKTSAKTKKVARK